MINPIGARAKRLTSEQRSGEDQATESRPGSYSAYFATTTTPEPISRMNMPTNSLFPAFLCTLGLVISCGQAETVPSPDTASADAKLLDSTDTAAADTAADSDTAQATDTADANTLDAIDTDSAAPPDTADTADTADIANLL